MFEWILKNMKSRNDTVMKRYSNNKSYDQVKGTKKYEMKGKIYRNAKHENKKRNFR